jgi:hypothetical protein
LSQKYIPDRILKFESDHYKKVQCVAYDSSGNAWICGFFENEMVTGDGLVKAMAKRVLFITFLNGNGLIRWRKVFSGHGNSGFHSAVITSEQNLFISGWSDDTLMVEGISYSGGAGQQVFTMLMEPDGTVRSFDIIIENFPGRFTSMDANMENDLLFGYHHGQTRVADEVLQPNGKHDVLILKLDSGLPEVLPISLSGTGKLSNITGRALRDELVIAGEFSRKLIVGDTLLNARGKSDIFLVRFNARYEMISAMAFGSGKNDKLGSMEHDMAGNIYLTGSFEGVFGMDTKTIKSNGNQDVFVVSLDTGNCINWVQSWGGAADDQGSALVIDGQGKVIIGGTYKNQIQIFSDTLVGSQRYSNGFLVCLDTKNGQPEWTMNVPGKSGVSPLILAGHRGEKVLVSGIFYDQVHIEGHVITSKKRGDIFLATMLNPCNDFSFDLSDHSYICQAGPDTLDAGPGFQKYFWNDGLSDARYLVIDDPGKYWVDVVDPNGCQASDTVIVALDSISYRIDTEAESMPAGNNGRIAITPLTGMPPFSIRWMDNSTEMERHGLSAGHYSFTLSDMSGCQVFGEVDVEEEYSTGILDVLATPNPVTGLSRIWYSLPDNEWMQLALYDHSGRKIEVIHSGIYNKGTHVLDWVPDRLKPGIYYLKLTTRKATATCRIMIN